MGIPAIPERVACGPPQTFLDFAIKHVSGVEDIGTLAEAERICVFCKREFVPQLPIGPRRATTPDGDLACTSSVLRIELCGHVIGDRCFGVNVNQIVAAGTKCPHEGCEAILWGPKREWGSCTVRRMYEHKWQMLCVTQEFIRAEEDEARTSNDRKAILRLEISRKQHQEKLEDFLRWIDRHRDGIPLCAWKKVQRFLKICKYDIEMAPWWGPKLSRI